MKKIVIMSDNHGDNEMLEKIKQLEPCADYYIHCGDSEVDDKRLLRGYICVKGNNDWVLDLPQQAILKIEGFHILVVHGHMLNRMHLELSMNDILTRHRCQVLIYGHTHIPMFEQSGDFYYINPGSTTFPRGGHHPSYAVVTIDHDILDCQIKEIKA